MSLRKFGPAAAKRIGVVFDQQRHLKIPAIGPYLRKQQSSLLENELGFRTRNFRCSSSYHYTAQPYSTSSISGSADVAAERSGGKKKGKGNLTADNLKIKERPVVFKCQNCEALCVKRVQQEHFENGVVIVRCLECRNVNLVADNLGLFKEKDSMQKFLSESGVDLRYGAEGSYELLAEDLVKMDEQKVQRQQQQQVQQPDQQQQQATTA